ARSGGDLQDQSQLLRRPLSLDAASLRAGALDRDSGDGRNYRQGLLHRGPGRDQISADPPALRSNTPGRGGAHFLSVRAPGDPAAALAAVIDQSGPRVALGVYGRDLRGGLAKTSVTAAPGWIWLAQFLQGCFWRAERAHRHYESQQLSLAGSGGESATCQCGQKG